MNSCNIEFLERNGIDIDEVVNSIDCKIKTPSMINSVINDNFFSKPLSRNLKMVSIADILGYEQREELSSENIFQSMDLFFDEKGDGYHQRSVGMLEYTEDNIIQKLESSFNFEPISIKETGEGSYVVNSNGLHRYTILRILYLNEVSKAKENKKELERLAQKYTIPVQIEEVDFEKTYCKYLLKNIRSEIDESPSINRIQTNYDENYKNTGMVEIKFSDGTKKIMNNEELIELTREKIIKNGIPEYSNYSLQDKYSQYESFRTFVDSNFSDILQLKQINGDVKGVDENDNFERGR